MESLKDAIANVAENAINVLGGRKENKNKKENFSNDKECDAACMVIMGIIWLFLIIASLGLTYIQIMALILALRCNKGDTKWIHFMLLIVLGGSMIPGIVYYIMKRNCKPVKD